MRTPDPDWIYLYNIYTGILKVLMLKPDFTAFNFIQWVVKWNYTAGAGVAVFYLIFQN